MAGTNNRNAVALRPSRLPMPDVLAGEYGLTSESWRVLVDQVFPMAKTPEAVALALSYCKNRGLDPFKRPVHIVPMYSAAAGGMIETVWPGISEIRTTATRTGAYAGIDEIEFGPDTTRTFKGKTGGYKGEAAKEYEVEVTFPSYAKATVYRFVKGNRVPFVAKVFWMESYAVAGKGGDAPNEMWRKRPHGQIAKCAEAAALRQAFPEEVGNELSAEEMYGQIIDHDPMPRGADDGKISMANRYAPSDQTPAPVSSQGAGIAGGGIVPPPNAAAGAHVETGVIEDVQSEVIEEGPTDEENAALKTYWEAMRDAILNAGDGKDAPPLTDVVRAQHGEFSDNLSKMSDPAKKRAAGIWKSIVAITKGEQDIQTAAEFYNEMFGVSDDG